MKIMQVVYPGLGGNSSVAFSLVEGQNKIYKNLFIFAGVENLRKDFIEKCKKNKIEYKYYKKKRLQFNISKLINESKNFKPNIILIHDYFILPFFFYKLKFKKTVICFIHHTPDKTKNFIQWIFFFLNYFLSDKTILVSKRNKSSLIYKMQKANPKKIRVIENGINVKKFKK